MINKPYISAKLIKITCFQLLVVMGWQQQLLRINLTSKQVNKEKIPRSVLEKVIGGKGLGAYYLNRELLPQTNPLDPDNMIIVATGPAQGVLPIAGRYTIVTKSPLSGIFIDSHVGGFLGPELKFAGYDAIIITGKSEQPVYIQINNDEVEIKDATHLWGKDIMDTTDTINEEFDEKARIVCIGPAGENMARIAATNSDYFRTAARGGIGMVFGSKNLKAVSIRGTGEVRVHDPEKVKQIRRDINRRTKTARDDGHQLHRIGTSWLVPISNFRDQMPTLNYQQGEWEHVEEIEGLTIEKKFEGKIKPKPCYRCPLGCSYVLDTDYEWAQGKMIQHPEYESISLLGSNLGVKNLDTLVRLNHMCNILGLDTISTGSAISWFIECGQRFAVPDQYKSELVDFGDEAGIVKLIEKIAYGRGVGKVLAQGVRRASEIFGEPTEEWAVHVRGLELPAWDPRGKLGLGLSYITSNVGGSHLRGWPRTSGVPDRESLSVVDGMIEEQDLKILKDSFVMCHFTHSITPAFSIEDAAVWYEALTGVPSTFESMRELAQHIWILCRQFNVGVWGEKTPRETDVLPPRLMKEGLPSGIAKGKTAFVSEDDMNRSLDYFYERRNCYADGRPKEPVIL